jgi:hypothetical protein
MSLNSVRLTDLDELVLTVRDAASRALIQEGLDAYRGGAYRSAIISTWIAVAHDVISKIRELTLQGDRRATEISSTINTATRTKNVPQLQRIENALLTIAFDDFAFLQEHELKDLVRLKEDRDLCAHPALVAENALFAPTPELVRTHIVHAIQHLLQHKAVQGKSAIDHIMSDLVQESFPDDADGVRLFLYSKYLDRAKDVLVRNLTIVLLKSLLSPTDAPLDGKERRIVHALGAISRGHSLLYETVVPGALATIANGLDDKRLPSLFWLLGADRRCWRWAGEATRLRMRELVAKADVDESILSLARCDAFSAFDLEELAPVLAAAFSRLSSSGKRACISERPRPEFADEAVKLYAGANTFRTAEALGEAVLLPMARYLSGPQVIAVLEAVESNGQIWNAGGSPQIMDEFFDRTSSLLESTRDAWVQLVRAMSENTDPQDRFSYPGLRRKLAAHGVAVD